MNFRLALLVLGPLLYLQGRIVRGTTLKLPEAAGPRQGRQGRGPPIRLLIAGDSAAAGVGVSQQSQALAGRLTAQLCERHAVGWQLLAQSGLTSGQLLEALRAAPTGRFDVAIVSVGVNDVTALTRSRTWVSNLHAIVRTLQDQWGVRQILLSSLPPMHRFPALPQPLRWWLGLRAGHFNALMQAVAGTAGRCQYLDIPYPADPAYIASDGFHPGARAYQLWADEVASRIAVRFGP